MGINYWFGPKFVMKASFHDVEGNRFAYPPEVSVDGSVSHHTRLFEIGSQFAF